MDPAEADVSAERKLRVQPSAERPLRCGDCDAPVDGVQRYCIVCGAHQSRIEDPVARYLAQASARRRQSGTHARAHRRLTVGGASLVLCLALAVFVGALAGRVSNDGDAAIIAALRARPAPAVSVPLPAGSTARNHLTSPAAPRTDRSRATERRPAATTQKSTGGGYVHSQQGLPNSISVP